MDKYVQQALLEYNNEEYSPRPGDVDGNPFWNVKATQFMFVPILQFSEIPAEGSYLYTATDKNGKVHTFKGSTNVVSLASVWGEIADGNVELKVEVTDDNGNVIKLLGERTIFKCLPFPGREAYPKKACSYRECALKALRFVYEDPMVQHWLIHGLPEPDYAHNAYPSKTISIRIFDKEW